jgi:glycosyltransferase involved in cell wall biosynthesis
MKLLVVGHSYVTAFAQSKYVALKRQWPELTLRIAIPNRVGHLFGEYRPEVADGLTPEEVVAIRDYFGKLPMSYVFSPLQFAQLLKEFRPNHIHIEEDPHSAVGFEVVFMAGIFAQKATISFFVWDNLARVPRFPFNIVKKALTRYGFSHAHLVVCGNQEARRLLHGVKRYRGMSTVLPQVGLNQPDYESPPSDKLRRALISQGGAPLIGFVGRIVPEKGVVLLLEALEGLQDLNWSLLILGSGPLEQDIRTTWKARLRDRLTLVSPVPHSEVPRYLKCLDIFVLPSTTTPRWKEQFGLTLAQAMMSGVACIGSSSGAIPEILGSGGLIFREGDRQSLTEALKRLILSDSERRAFGDAAKRYAFDHYTNEKVSIAYKHAFLQCI